MQGKVCIVSGSNSGIGFITALEFAKKGAHVVMICRNEQKGLEAKKDIILKSDNENVDLIIGDLSSQSEIRRIVEIIKAKYPVIDVLVNNAGAIIDTREETVDGLERTFATNHLGYFLLTNLLLDNLKAAENARIVSVASGAERMGKLNFDDLQTKNNYTAWKAYCLSKLANVIFTFELAKRLKGTNVTANCMHPGVVNTGFGKDLTGIWRVFSPIMGIFFRNSEKGAETVVWLAESADVEGVTGKFFKDKKELKAQAIAYTAEAQAKLWEVSLNLVGL
jgi:NAD(P)-dependent dehydrogenase (short-subunit alcohol dehydrogenase family)